MKKAISLLLSLVMLTGVLSVNANVFAAGYLDYVQNMEFNCWYSDNATTSDYNNKSSKPDSYSYYDIYKFTVPEKGEVTIKLRAEDYFYFCDYITIVNVNNTETKIFESYGYDGYDNAAGEYFKNFSVPLNAGTYYLEYPFERYNVECNRFTGNYSIYSDYRPTFSNTSFLKITAKKKAFNVKWKKASGVTGYEIQYSLKKNMKNSTKTKVKKASTVSKTIKGLKAKKKYYVRIRTYKTVNVDGRNKTYYGKWSTKKPITTKK